MKTTIKIIIAVALTIGAIALYNQHEEAVRAEYAATNNCTWTFYGSHDLCR